MNANKSRSQKRILHRSRRPFQRAKDAAILAFYGLGFEERGAGGSRLRKVPEQRELFEEAPSV